MKKIIILCFIAFTTVMLSGCNFQSIKNNATSNKDINQPSVGDPNEPQAPANNFDKNGTLVKGDIGFGNSIWALVYYDYPGSAKLKVYLFFTGKSICVNQPPAYICNPDKFGGDYVNVVGRLYETNKVAVSKLSVFIE